MWSISINHNSWQKLQENAIVNRTTSNNVKMSNPFE